GPDPIAPRPGRAHERHAHRDVPSAVADTVEHVADGEERGVDEHRREPPERIERESREGDRHQPFAAEAVAELAPRLRADYSAADREGAEEHDQSDGDAEVSDRHR